MRSQLKNNAGSKLIDTHLGSAYDTVQKVADNMEVIKGIDTLIPQYSFDFSVSDHGFQGGYYGNNGYLTQRLVDISLSGLEIDTDVNRVINLKIKIAHDTNWTGLIQLDNHLVNIVKPAKYDEWYTYSISLKEVTLNNPVTTLLIRLGNEVDIQYITVGRLLGDDYTRLPYLENKLASDSANNEGYFLGYLKSTWVEARLNTYTNYLQNNFLINNSNLGTELTERLALIETSIFDVQTDVGDLQTPINVQQLLDSMEGVIALDHLDESISTALDTINNSETGLIKTINDLQTSFNSLSDNLNTTISDAITSANTVLEDAIEALDVRLTSYNDTVDNFITNVNATIQVQQENVDDLTSAVLLQADNLSETADQLTLDMTDHVATLNQTITDEINTVNNTIAGVQSIADGAEASAQLIRDALGTIVDDYLLNGSELSAITGRMGDLVQQYEYQTAALAKSSIENSIKSNNLFTQLAISIEDIKKFKEDITTAFLNIDPEAGQVTIEAISFQLQETLATLVNIGLQVDALEEELNLYATKTALDGTNATVTDLGVRLSTAENTLTLKANQLSLDDTNTTLNSTVIRMDAAESAIALKASTEALTDAEARIDAAEISISGLNAAILLKASSQSVSDLDVRTTTAETNISALTNTVATKISDSLFYDAIAPLFDPAESYVVDDEVVYQAQMYKATEAISPGTFDVNQWELLGNIQGRFATAESSLTALSDDYAAFKVSLESLDLTTEIPKIATIDSSLVTLTNAHNALANSVTTLTTNTDNSFSVVNSTLASQASDIASSATDISTLQTGLGTTNASVASLNTALTTETNARVSQYTELEGRVGDTEGNYTDLLDFNIEPTSALFTKFQSIDASINNANTNYQNILDLDISDTSNLFTKFESIEANLDSVEASYENIITLTLSPESALLSTLNSLQGDVDGANGSIQDLLNLNISAGSVLAQKFTTMEADIDDNTASFNSLVNLTIDENSVLATKLDNIETTADNAYGLVNDLLTLNISPSSALLSKLNSLQTSVDDNEAGFNSLVNLTVDPNSAIATKFDTIEATANTAEGKANSVINFTVSPTSALAVKFDTLEGRVEDAEALYEDVVALNIEPDSVLATTLTSLDGRVGDNEGKYTDILNLNIDSGTLLLSKLNTIEGKADNATGLAEDIIALDLLPSSALLTKFSNIESDVLGNTSSINTLEVITTGLTESVATSYNELKSSFTASGVATIEQALALYNSNLKQAALDAKVSTFEETFTDSLNAEATRVSTIEAKLEAVDKSILLAYGGINRVENTTVTLENGLKATAQVIEEVKTSVADNTALFQSIINMEIDENSVLAETIETINANYLDFEGKVTAWEQVVLGDSGVTVQMINDAVADSQNALTQSTNILTLDSSTVDGTALGNKLDTLTAAILDENGDSIAEASLTAAADLVATESSARATAVSAVEVKANTAQSTIDAHIDAYTTAELARNTEISAINSRIDDNEADITEVQTTTVTLNQSTAQAFKQLESYTTPAAMASIKQALDLSSIKDANAAFQAYVKEFEETVTTDKNATATRFESVESSLADTEAGINLLYGAVNNVSKAVTSVEDGLSVVVSNLVQTNAEISDVKTYAETLTTSQITHDKNGEVSTVSSILDSIELTVANETARLNEVSAVAYNAQNGFTAMWGVSATVGEITGSFGLYASETGTQMVFKVGSFVIYNEEADTLEPVFAIEGTGASAKVIMQNVVANSVTTNAINGIAVSEIFQQMTSTDVDIVGGQLNIANKATIDSGGNAEFTSITIKDDQGNVILSSGNKISGSAVVGLTYDQVGGTKPDANARTNKAFRQATDPGSAAKEDDTWYNPNTFLYQRRTSSNTWELIGNGFSNTNQLTDGAGLGNTAIWNNISGTGKPANSATRNRNYYQESEPVGASGDWWYKPSTEELKQHNGSGWYPVSDRTNYNDSRISNNNIQASQISGHVTDIVDIDYVRGFANSTYIRTLVSEQAFIDEAFVNRVWAGSMNVKQLTGDVVDANVYVFSDTTLIQGTHSGFNNAATLFSFDIKANSDFERILTMSPIELDWDTSNTSGMVAAGYVRIQAFRKDTNASVSVLSRAFSVDNTTRESITDLFYLTLPQVIADPQNPAYNPADVYTELEVKITAYLNTTGVSAGAKVFIDDAPQLVQIFKRGETFLS